MKKHFCYLMLPAIVLFQAFVEEVEGYYPGGYYPQRNPYPYYQPQVYVPGSGYYPGNYNPGNYYPGYPNQGYQQPGNTNEVVQQQGSSSEKNKVLSNPKEQNNPQGNQTEENKPQGNPNLGANPLGNQLGNPTTEDQGQGTDGDVQEMLKREIEISYIILIQLIERLTVYQNKAEVGLQTRARNIDDTRAYTRASDFYERASSDLKEALDDLASSLKLKNEDLMKTLLALDKKAQSEQGAQETVETAEKSYQAVLQTITYIFSFTQSGKVEQ